MKGKPRKGRPTDSTSIRPISENDASMILRKKDARKKRPDPVREIEKEELESLHADLETAQQIQQTLLPERIPKIPGYDFDSYYSPAGKVGGDFYDFIQFADNTLGFLVADASGKGLAGSLLMVQARAVIRAMASVCSSPREILVRANQVLHRDFKPGTFITIFMGILDLREATLKVASAGHDPMLLWKWKTKKCFAINPSGLVLGAAKENIFNETLKESTVKLEPGDRFTLYTDGVTELMDFEGQEFGKTRLVRCTLGSASKSSADYVNALVGDLENHRSNFAQSDDITILTGRVMPEDQIWPEDLK